MKNRLSIGIIIAALAALLSLAGCASDPHTQNQVMKTGALGGVIGGIAGALINSGNPWQGGAIGAALGASIAGGTAYIASQASHQAAQTQQPVAYQHYDTRQRVESYPQGQGPGNCRKVIEKYYEKGRLVKTVERDVCN